MRLIVSLIFLTPLLFTGCYFENKIQKQGAIESRDPKLEAFVELENGEVLKFGVLKIRRPPLQYEYLEGDGKKLDIAAKDIKAFQTESYYAYKLFNKAGGVIGKLPFSELFGERIVNGKIELFVISEKSMNAYGPNQSGYVKNYYLRKGKNNPLIFANEATLQNMIRDNKAVLEDFDKLYKRTYIFKSIMKILERYN